MVKHVLIHLEEKEFQEAKKLGRKHKDIYLKGIEYAKLLREKIKKDK